MRWFFQLSSYTHLFHVALVINHSRKRVSEADSVISEYHWYTSLEAWHSKESKIGNKTGRMETFTSDKLGVFHGGSIGYIC